jgi:hypothetical protein
VKEKTKPKKTTPNAKARKTASTRPAKPKKGLSFHFTGVLEVRRNRKGELTAQIYASAAEAATAGVHADIIRRIWEGEPNPQHVLPECSTLGTPEEHGIWVTCRDNGCKGELGCHVESWPRGKPGDWRDEGEGVWALPGRVYRCTCLYEG